LEDFDSFRLPYSESIFKPIYIKKLILKYLIKIYLKLELNIYYNQSSGIFFGISNGFLKKYNIIKNCNCNIEELSELTQKAIKNNSVILNEHDHLLVMQGDHMGVIKQDSLLSTYEKLIYHKADFVVKDHPSFQSPKILKTLPFFPSFIPSELLLCNINKSVISIYSSTLILSSKLYRLKCISLLDLIEWESNDSRIKIKNWLLKESKNKIIFPKTIKDLFYILQ
jgi:hypothetical protein